MSAAPSADAAALPLVQRLGAVLWPAFFAAGVATMVFFAHVDPLLLHDAGVPVPATREGAYAVGFLALWLATASSSWVTAILLRAPARAMQTPGAPPSP